MLLMYFIFYVVKKLSDQFYKLQNAPVSYAKMLHLKQKCAHFRSGWSIVAYGTSAFWDLWNWAIVIGSDQYLLALDKHLFSYSWDY